jgi:hypothetical protein
MEQEHEDYAEPDAGPLPVPSLRAILITLVALAVAAAVWFYVAVLLPARAC